MILRLLTYNIHRSIGVDHQFRPERTIEILEHYNPDIALLQEVDHGVPRSGELDLAGYIARSLKYDYHALGLNVILRKGKYGNATLSRFPIGKQRNIDLTIGWHKKRGAQHTSITVWDGKHQTTIEVFNIHLGLSAGERQKQLKILLESPDLAQLDPSTPCIVAGDMNDWRGVLRRRCFLPAGFQCATNKHSGFRWAIKTFPSFAPAGGLDKIFYRGKIKLLRVHRSRLQLARVASDHLPVIAEFEV